MPPEDPEQPRPPVKRRRRRWLKRLLIGLIVLLILVVIAVQAVLMSGIPRRIVLGQVQSALGLRMSAESVSTGWLGHTTLRQVTLSLPLAEKSFVEVPTLRVRHASLLRLLLTRSLDIQSMELDQPAINLRQDDSGAWNVQRALQLVARTAGSHQAADAAQSSSPVRLPDLTVNGGQIVITNNSGQTATIAPVTAKGWRNGELVYKYDADLASQLKLTGQLAPTARWDHEVEFTAKDLAELVAPLIHGIPPDLNASGTWAGHVEGDAVQGRLDLSSLTAEDVNLSGSAGILAKDGAVEIRPDGMNVKAPPLAAAGTILLSSGVVSLASGEVNAQQLTVGIGGGQAVFSGKWNGDAGNASIDAAWRDVVFPKAISESGHLSGTLSTPWPGHPSISSSIDAIAATPAGTLTTSMRLEGQGDSFSAIDWKTSIKQIAWQGKQNISLNDLTAELRTRRRQIYLDRLSFAAQQSIAARGQFDFDAMNWWLWSHGENLSLHGDIQEPLSYDLNSWGHGGIVRLEELYARLGRLEVSGFGGYDSQLPKPVTLELNVSRFPIESAAVSSGESGTLPIRGSLVSRVEVAGTIQPVQMDLMGQLHAEDLTLLGRDLGNVDISLEGSADPKSAEIHSTRPLLLLGGQWRVKGHWPTTQPHEPAQLDVTVDGLRLADVSQLARAGALRGDVNGEILINLGGLRLSKLNASAQLSAANVSAGPLQAERATANIGFHDGTLSIAPLELTHDNGTATATISFSTDHPAEWSVHARTHDWPLEHGNSFARFNSEARLTLDMPAKVAVGSLQIDGQLSNKGRSIGTVAVKAQLERSRIIAQQIEAHLLDGMAQGNATVDWAAPLESVAQLDWQNVDTGLLANWLPKLDGLKGHSSGQLRLSPDNSPHAIGPLELRIQENPTDAQYRGIARGDSNLLAYFDHDRAVVDHATFSIAGGTISLFARATRRDDGTITSLASGQFEGLDLAQLTMAAKPAAGPVPGIAAGNFNFGGDPRIPKEMFGELTVHLKDSELGNWAPVAVLYDAMHVAFGKQAPSGTATAQARLDGDTLAVTRLRIFNRGVEVIGVGNVQEVWSMPQSPLNATLVGSTKPLQDIKLPFFADVDKILSALQANLTTVIVKGTVKDPKVQLGTFADIGLGLRSILVGDVSGETQGSASP